MNPLISVIVTTYNRPDALHAVLQGLLVQPDDHFEIVVADDGSRDDTAAVVQTYARQGRIGVQHVWQEDRGFRAGAARNRAVERAQGDYLIFLDGDCVPRSHWIARHRRLMEPGWMVAGNRALLSAAFTTEVLAKTLPIHQWHYSRWCFAAQQGHVNRLAPFTYLPLGPLRKWAAHRWQRIRTCNLALWRKDFYAVNGFDESFQGWGFEDSDLAIRLLNHGVRRKEGAWATGVLHLWHRENDRAQEGVNWERLQQRLKARATRATQGLVA